MHVVLDENVSLEATRRLETMGYQVISIARSSSRGISDQKVFALAVEKQGLLVTRDTHFTNPIRFPAHETSGIIYITRGNLRGSEEADLLEHFLESHPPETFKGKLVFLSRTGAGIR